MVILPSGGSMMGSDPEERRREGVPKLFADREGPRHKVTIARSFAMSATEITLALYAQFAKDTGMADVGCATFDPKTDTWPMQARYSWHDPGFPVTGSHPAGCVNWSDASAFAAWLARKTGKHYRLPSEAEWEYGARAGSESARYWGDDATSICERTNIMSRGTLEKLGWPKSWNDKLICSTDRSFTQPVASYAANAFGLYDMLGNVWEWVADCYHPTYDGAPVDGSAWLEPGCRQRIPRGGGLHSEPWLARAATRGMAAGDYRGIAAGIRVARDLE
jgi:formylglycine-generating enzyme required for sulfatase activity